MLNKESSAILRQSLADLLRYRGDLLIEPDESIATEMKHLGILTPSGLTLTSEYMSEFLIRILNPPIRSHPILAQYWNEQIPDSPEIVWDRFLVHIILPKLNGGKRHVFHPYHLLKELFSHIVCDSNTKCDGPIRVQFSFRDICYLSYNEVATTIQIACRSQKCYKEWWLEAQTRFACRERRDRTKSQFAPKTTIRGCCKRAGPSLSTGVEFTANGSSEFRTWRRTDGWK